MLEEKRKEEKKGKGGKERNRCIAVVRWGDGDCRGEWGESSLALVTGAAYSK